mmetsp:Transcript_36993/g.45232  ORF Transcript_36993/g.45232 Transcript_36993/m.45232 type:complete len:253 (+) Transcript_36993:88-846(+)
MRSLHPFKAVATLTIALKLHSTQGAQRLTSPSMIRNDYFIFTPSMAFIHATAITTTLHKQNIGRRLPMINTRVSGLDIQPPRPNGNTYWVTPHLIAGEYPTSKNGDHDTRRKLRQYLDRGITTFLDLTRDGEKESYTDVLAEEASKKGLVVDYRRLAVTDFGVPDTERMTQILDVIDDAIEKKGGKIYVHCRGGIGRTGTVVGCYLVRHGNVGDEALEMVNRLFQNSGRSRESWCSPETTEQINFVKEWNEE